MTTTTIRWEQSTMLDVFTTLDSHSVHPGIIKAMLERAIDYNGEYQDDKELILLLWYLDLCNGYAEPQTSKYDDCLIELDGAEYLVLDEDEREQRWDEALENYLDECVEGSDSRYFDRELWKRDARIDGAGHALNACEEDEIKVGENWFFIYRVN